MRPIFAIVTLTLLACGAPPGRPAESAEDAPASSPARVTVEEEATVAEEALDTEGNAAATGSWPTDGNLAGADAERLRVGIDNRPARGAAEPRGGEIQPAPVIA